MAIYQLSIDTLQSIVSKIEKVATVGLHSENPFISNAMPQNITQLPLEQISGS